MFVENGVKGSQEKMWVADAEQGDHKDALGDGMRETPFGEGVEHWLSDE